MVKSQEDYSNFVRRVFAENGEDTSAYCRNITFQVTGSCNLCCSYCYENHKSCGSMTLETGKKIVDYILDLYEDGTSDFVNKTSKAVVLDFIGGEPLIEAELIEHICDYWFSQCYKRNAPLAPFTRISFATNGLLWFSKASQSLFRKYHDLMSVTVSIDGVKELHDAYRLDASGGGSFTRAYKAFQAGKKYGWVNSKMTFIPDSFPYISDSIKFMISEGCTDIKCNYAYEPVYTEKDARVLYQQLKNVSDYLIENKLDVAISILDDFIGNPTTENQNYCGGTGAMLSFAPDGKAYPCIRYAPISVGPEKAAPMCLGDCYGGLYKTKEQRDKKAELDAITRESQSTEECMNCQVATGCGWCSAYNYECFGTPNKRATNICLAHKARVLSACYYYNKRSMTLCDCEPKKINLPIEEAERLIGEESARELYELAYKAIKK